MNNSEFGDDSILDWYNTNSGSYGYFHKKEKTKNKKTKRKKENAPNNKKWQFLAMDHIYNNDLSCLAL